MELTNEENEGEIRTDEGRRGVNLKVQCAKKKMEKMFRNT